MPYGIHATFILNTYTYVWLYQLIKYRHTLLSKYRFLYLFYVYIYLLRLNISCFNHYRVAKAMFVYFSSFIDSLYLSQHGMT